MQVTKPKHIYLCSEGTSHVRLRVETLLVADWDGIRTHFYVGARTVTVRWNKGESKFI